MTPQDIFQRLTLKDDPDAADIYRRLLQRGGGDGKPKCARVQYIPFRIIWWPLPKCEGKPKPKSTLKRWMKEAITWVFLCKLQPKIKCDPTKYITVTFENHAYGEYLKRSRLIVDNSPIPIMGDAKE